MLKFIRKLIRMVKNYDSDLASLRASVSEVVGLIRERTEVHADIHMKSPSQVIVIGRYKGKDFVNIYRFDQDDLSDLVSHLERITRRYARPGRFDAPWPEVHAVIERNLQETLWNTQRK
jgi:hypothetical protein